MNEKQQYVQLDNSQNLSFHTINDIMSTKILSSEMYQTSITINHILLECLKFKPTQIQSFENPTTMKETDKNEMYSFFLIEQN